MFVFFNNYLINPTNNKNVQVCEVGWMFVTLSRKTTERILMKLYSFMPSRLE